MKLHFYTYTNVGMIANKLQTATTTRCNIIKKEKPVGLQFFLLFIG